MYLKAFFSKYKLRSKIIFFNIIAMIVILLIVSNVIYGTYLSNMQNYILDSLKAYFDQTYSRVDEYFKDIGNISKVVFYNESFQNLLSRENEISIKNYVNDMRGSLDTFAETNSSINGVHFVDNKNNIYSSSGAYINEEQLLYIKDTVYNNPDFNSGKSVIIQLPHESEYYLSVNRVNYIKKINYLDSAGIGILYLRKSWISGVFNINSTFEDA